MSLSSLAEEEVAQAQRRLPVTEYGAGIVAPRPLTTTTVRTLDLRDRTASRGTAAAATVLDALARYVPTEIVTLYLTALSAMPALTATFAQVTDVRVYWFFAILTPILLLLVLAGKRRRDGLSPFPGWSELPWWKLAASTIAFIVWALAVPNTPYLTGQSGKVVAAFGALLVSTFLTLLEPIFERAPRPLSDSLPAGSGGRPKIDVPEEPRL
jgi:hypothetical protein